MEIKFPLSNGGVTLATEEKYCAEDITVTPEFSEDIPLITSNGSYDVKVNSEVEVNVHQGHVFEDVTVDSSADKITGICRICGLEKVVDISNFPKEICQELLDNPEDTIYDFDANTFANTGYFSVVEDSTAYKGVALYSNPNDTSAWPVKNPNYYGMITDISIDTSEGHHIGRITLEEQKANLGKGYCLYELKSVVLPTDPDGSVGYMTMFKNSALQNKTIWAYFNKLMNHTVDIYISMKIEGKLNWSKPYPSYYIDRIILIDRTSLESRLIDGTATIIVNEQVTKIGDYAFSSNGKLTHVNLPNVYTTGSHAFSYCNSLTSIDLPSVKTIGESTFRSCTNLTSICLPIVKTLCDYAFVTCTNLTSIDLPNVETIGKATFSACKGLTSITNLLNVKTIGKSAFYNCTSLPLIELPNIESIEAEAFQGCTKLKYIKIGYKKDLVSLGDYVFTSTPIASGKGYIYVPDNQVDSYKTAENWSTYADSIRPISEFEG